jgi:hypothetical protein
MYNPTYGFAPSPNPGAQQFNPNVNQAVSQPQSQQMYNPQQYQVPAGQQSPYGAQNQPANLMGGGASGGMAHMAGGNPIGTLHKSC